MGTSYRNAIRFNRLVVSAAKPIRLVSEPIRSGRSYRHRGKPIRPLSDPRKGEIWTNWTHNSREISRGNARGGPYHHPGTAAIRRRVADEPHGEFPVIRFTGTPPGNSALTRDAASRRRLAARFPGNRARDGKIGQIWRFSLFRRWAVRAKDS